MKKWIVLAAALFALGALGGCSGKGEEQEVLAPPPPAESQLAPPAQEGQPGEELSSQEETAPIRLYLNGNRLELDTPIQLEGEDVMVPIAEIVSAFSRSIETAQEGETLTLQDTERGNEIIITAGSDEATVNGSKVSLEAPALLTDNGVMLVELSGFRTLLEADNKYTADISSAYITESGLC